MKVLVTGASGFLGSHVAEQLIREGHEVRALVRKSSKRDFLERLGKQGKVEFAYGSVEDADKVAEAVKGVDAIIHSAGLVKARTPAEFHRTNVDGTRILLDAAKAHAPNLKRFVFVSSLTAAGPSHDGKPLEGDGSGPVTHYGRSKLEAEGLVLAAKDALPVTILRPAVIYGPRDQEILVFFKSVKSGVLPTVGKGDSTMSMVFGADCAAACVKAVSADVPSGSIYFVDDGEPYAFRTLVEGVETALGKRAFLRFNLPMSVIWVAAVSSELYGKLSNKAVMLNRDKINEIRQPHWVCSSARTRKDLHWEPQMKLQEGMAITARWYQDNGWL